MAGAGIAGSLIASGLSGRGDCELICLERVGADEQGEAGTGLNIGPNAIKCLQAHLPREAETIVSNSLPWSVWTVALTSGQLLMDLNLGSVADQSGIRIRWAELYALLREPLREVLTYNAELTGCGQDGGETFVTWVDRKTGAQNSIGGIDLLIAGDGRYSAIRQFVLGGPETPRFLNVCLYRVLFPAGSDCPIDDYGQWFNGPNRLLAYRVPGDFVYCAGSFPIPAGHSIPEEMKQPGFLRQAYSPAEGSPSREAAYLIESIVRYADRIHWARLQEGAVTYGRKDGILLAGDAAHPMVPTLGQGATQACEDACVTVDEIRLALAAGEPLSVVPTRVEARQAERARFAVELSRQATDTMLAGADPVAGTRWKTEPAFQRDLMKLYRDVSMPRGAGAEIQNRSSVMTEERVPPEYRFDGKVAIVTGAGDGIGFATVEGLARGAARVICLDVKNADRAAARARDLGADAEAVTMDVRDVGGWTRLLETTASRWGAVDILVNNAGIAVPGDTAADVSEDVWDRILEVNAKGVWIGMKAVLPGMLAKRSGKIVNVASTAAHIGLRDAAAYCASKGAVLALTRQAGVQYASDNVQINSVSPGTTMTGLQKDVTEQQRAAFLPLTPIGRFAASPEVAAVVLFLCSAGSSFMAGADIGVDGGMVAL